MGLYEDQILPRFVEKLCASAGFARWRRLALDGISGVVAEPGFGSGNNLEHFPDGVTKVYAIDPAVLGRRLGAKKISASPAEVEFVGLSGEEIPLDDDSCDAGVLTFTLCTIPDPAAALAELRRVIKPGGRLHFAEHGLAAEPSIQRWQHRLEPWQKTFGGGCHLSRDHPELIRQAGFEMDWCETIQGDRVKPWTHIYYGQAVNP